MFKLCFLLVLCIFCFSLYEYCSIKMSSFTVVNFSTITSWIVLFSWLLCLWLSGNIYIPFLLLLIWFDFALCVEFHLLQMNVVNVKFNLNIPINYILYPCFRGGVSLQLICFLTLIICRHLLPVFQWRSVS